MEGYIYLWRKIIKEPFYKNPKVCHLAIHLILTANHKDNTFLFDNQEVTIKRGQLLTGIKKLTEITGVSPASIRSACGCLTRCGFLTIKTTNKYSIITVNKYADYQSKQQTKQQTNNKQTTNNSQTENKQITTNNNDNNVNNTYSEPKEPTPKQIVIEEFKRLKGYDKDTTWNKIHYKRHLKPASTLLACFDSNLQLALECLKITGKKFDSDGLDGWGLEGIIKQSSKFKLDYEKTRRLLDEQAKIQQEQEEYDKKYLAQESK